MIESVCSTRDWLLAFHGYQMIELYNFNLENYFYTYTGFSNVAHMLHEQTIWQFWGPCADDISTWTKTIFLFLMRSVAFFTPQDSSAAL